MHSALSAILAVALLTIPAAAAGPELAFRPPAQAGGTLTAQSGQWLLLEVRGEHAADFSVASSSAVQTTNRTDTRVHVGTPIMAMNPQPTSADPRTREWAGGLQLAGVLQQEFPRTLMVWADSIHVTAAATAQLAGIDPGAVASTYVPGSDDEEHAIRPVPLPNGHAVAALVPQGPGGFQVMATGVRSVEWHGATITCNQESCPSGGGSWSDTMPGSPVRIRNDAYVELTGTNMSLNAAGAFERLVIGSSSLDLQVLGWIRLPLASASKPCDGCAVPANQTFWATGDLALNGVRANGDGTMSLAISGDIDGVRFDETTIDPKALGAWSVAAGGAALGVGLVLKLLLAPLFTRLGRKEALEHPRRKAIFDYVQAHPGANFREVARKTGIAAGTVRHHLTILERSGHLVERPHNGTVRLFENHGKFDHNWADLVLLREPTLGILHEWLKNHPGSPQKVILEAMEQAGWSRSTTQHRLTRLAEGGLVAIRLQGRLKIYTATQSQPARPSPGTLLPAHLGSPHPAVS